MRVAPAAPPSQKSLKDPALKEDLQRLRQTDNLTNWYYIARIYLYFVLVIGSAIGFDVYRISQGWSVLWSVPVFLVAIVLVGAGQHQLSALAHEAVHHILFKNRYLNDLASDLFSMFPLFSTTHHYRLQHLAHHQFVNDPERDPDISQLQASGHWLHFPVSKREFVASLLKQLWIPNLIKFIRIRAIYNSTGTGSSPYVRKGTKRSKLPVRVGILYLLIQVGLLTTLTWLGDSLWLAIAPALLLAGVLTFYAVLPARFYHQSRIHSVFSQRTMAILRMTFLTALFCSLAWLTMLTGYWAAVYFMLLWHLPIMTSFAFFMILRQWVQHGNGDRGWLTNTRVFLVSSFFRFSVFPIGQDYHLPHHMFATVPHYRLRELHEILLRYPEYRTEAIEVHGYFHSPERPQIHPTVLDVVGPEFAANEFRGVFIDNSVLEDVKVEEKEVILAEGAREQQRVADLASRSA